MNIPSNGRIVIVDDKTEDEALPLITALSRKGVPFRYFTGKPRELPEKPLNGVRLLFLDLKLEGMDFTNDTENIVSSLRPVIEKLIDKSNGPYGIIGWTKTPEHLARLREVLDPKPLFAIDLEKSACLKGGTTCDLAVVEEKLKTVLPDLAPFEALFRWESLVNESSYNTINQFHEFFPDADAGKSLSALFYRLAKAGVGENVGDISATERTVQALLAFSEALGDNLESSISPERLEGLALKVDAPTAGGADEQKIDARLNAKIHIATADPSGTNCVPGNVYAPYGEESKALGQALLDESKDFVVKKDGEDPLSGAVPLILEVSPICDHDQKKWRRHRVLPLLALPPAAKIKNSRSLPESIYIFPSLYFEPIGKTDPFQVIADIRFLTSVPLADFKEKKPIFRFRKELLNDLQSRIARHINRPGILSL